MRPCDASPSRSWASATGPRRSRWRTVSQGRKSSSTRAGSAGSSGSGWPSAALPGVDLHPGRVALPLRVPGSRGDDADGDRGLRSRLGVLRRRLRRGHPRQHVDDRADGGSARAADQPGLSRVLPGSGLRDRRGAGRQGDGQGPATPRSRAGRRKRARGTTSVADEGPAAQPAPPSSRSCLTAWVEEQTGLQPLSTHPSVSCQRWTDTSVGGLKRLHRTRLLEDPDRFRVIASPESLATDLDQILIRTLSR